MRLARAIKSYLLSKSDSVIKTSLWQQSADHSKTKIKCYGQDLLQQKGYSKHRRRSRELEAMYGMGELLIFGVTAAIKSCATIVLSMCASFLLISIGKWLSGVQF